MKTARYRFASAIEALLEWGGMKREIICLVIGGISLLFSLFDPISLPFDPAWLAIILCGVPIRRSWV